MTFTINSSIGTPTRSSITTVGIKRIFADVPLDAENTPALCPGFGMAINSHAGLARISRFGNWLVRTSDLLTSASRSEGMSPDEYLERLKKSGSDGGLYGGGPELTVLSNLLRRPISIYELEDDTTTTTTTAENNNNTNGESKYCRIKLAGVFGDHFKDPCLSIPNSAILSGLQPGAYSWHLHILVVDAGFEKHACALLPKFCDLP